MPGQHHLRMSRLQSRTRLLCPMPDPKESVSLRGRWLRQETTPKSPLVPLQPSHNATGRGKQHQHLAKTNRGICSPFSQILELTISEWSSPAKEIDHLVRPW